MTMPSAGHSYAAGDDEHDTPVEFFAPIAEAVGGFDLDPAASATSDLAAQNVTKEEDGLSMAWDAENVWLNPPYSEVSDWLAYARTQYAHGHCDRVVALVFARTGTQWWHNHATTANLRCLVEGRLTFGKADHSAPAPSAVLVWGDVPDALRRVLADRGEILERDRLRLDVDADLDEVLAPAPDGETQHNQWWSEADLRVVGRALRGDPPADAAEREARRILLNGVVYTLTGEQEVEA